MADDGSDGSESVWPIPKFYFCIELDGQSASFQEVSGLEVESQSIEYRAGDSKSFSTINMPGIKKTGSVTLKKGVFTKDSVFFNWYVHTAMNVMTRKTITVKLLDEGGEPTMVWTLSNAWPTKITATDLKSDGNEIVVETMEIAHEGLVVANA